MNQILQHRLKIEDAKFSFRQKDKENFLISFKPGQRRNLSSDDRSIQELLFAARLSTIKVFNSVGIESGQLLKFIFLLSQVKLELPGGDDIDRASNRELC